MLKSQGHGAWTGGHFAGKGEAGGGAFLTFVLRCRLLVWPHFLWRGQRGAVGKHNTRRDHLVAAVFLSELAKGRLNDAGLHTKHQEPGRLFLDIVI